MDGMPLTADMIRTFWDDSDGTLQQMLDDLVMRGYLVLEHPKDVIDGRRQQVMSLPLGYNIVTGKLSFRINQVLDPNGIAPTLVAMDMSHLYVPDGDGIRPISLREGLRMFGYPDDFKFDIDTKHGYDLLGNTVVVPVIRAVSSRLLSALLSMQEDIQPERSWLLHEDSNLDSRYQKPESCHWTMEQNASRHVSVDGETDGI